MRMVLLLLVSAGCCLAQGISESDRSYGLSALHGSRKQLVDATAGLSRAQWSFKPSAEAWSIAQIVEHLALFEEQVPRTIETILKTPAAPNLKPANPREADARILATVPRRTSKLQAPEQFRPSGRFAGGAEALKAFLAARDRNIAAYRTTEAPLRDHFFTPPGLGAMDAMQWYLFTAAHTERHVNQILEVKANPGYPKN